MAQVSQLTRFRGAVLAFTGVACGLGIYLVYSTYYQQPEKSTLHRSNAVHRPRQDRPQKPEVKVTGPDDEAPLGILIIRRGQHVHTTNLAFDQVPSLETIIAAIGSVPDETMDEVRHCATFGILTSCFRAPELGGRLSGSVFAPLPEALSLRNQESVRLARELLVAHVPGLDGDFVDGLVETTLSDGFMEASFSSPSSGTGAGIAETEELEGVNGAPREPSQGIKGLLYYIAEEDAKRKAYEHRGITCEECGESPIRGIRWHCLNCPDFDLCSTCEAQTFHQHTHVLVKIKIPLPVLSQPSQQYPLWYPGDPRKLHSPIDAGVRKRLAQQYAFEEPSIDALYDQFTCITNVPWASDPNKVQAAIDVRAFKKAMTPERWFSRLAPNAMYDRMFAFYDTDGNGLIGLEEFVSGIAYLRGPKRLSSIGRALKGFDIDGDGFVDRSDFLRMFGAKHSVQQHLVADMVEGHEAEQTMAAMEVLRSSQPISSLFCQEEIPQGEVRPQGGKQTDAYGDMQPLPGVKSILDDSDPWPREARRQPPRRVEHFGPDGASRERLRHHLSRFEEMLYGPSDVQPQQPQESAHTDQGATSDPPPDDGDKPPADKHESPESTINQDALLQIVEDGLNELLDPIFKDKEQLHREVLNTLYERYQWRTRIEEMLREKQAFQEELQSAAMVDPLMATAMESYGEVAIERKQQRDEHEPPFKADIVPTDSDSLARREAEIADKPLEELLEATGYGMMDGESDRKPSNGQGMEVATEDVDDETSNPAEPQEDTTSRTQPDEQPWDPTMPQHRPNAELPPSTSRDTPSQVKEKLGLAVPSHGPPSRQRLEYLAALDVVEREIEDRGGPGRLSLEEVEGMVRADTTKELRGLVVSWLEFASF